MWSKPNIRRHGRITRLIISIILAVIVVIFSIIGARNYYFNNLKAISNSQVTMNVSIPSGSSLKQVADLLHDKKLIRNSWTFQQYVRSKSLQSSILAGTYAIKPSQTVYSIVDIITNGRVASHLVTIKPAQRIDQVEQTLINSGFSPESVKTALDPANYANHPALVDKPSDASLEGYLYPESFQKTSETTPQQIIKLSLNEMQKRLTPEIREAFSSQGLSVHKAIILSSIVEREVSNPTDRAQVAQVFLKRLSLGQKLESDATASYGAILAGADPTQSYNSPYNTYRNSGLPPGPISNVSESSLQAVAHPASTDWLYFVSGDDGVTYFSRTLQEHESAVQQHCKKCSI